MVGLQSHTICHTTATDWLSERASVWASQTEYKLNKYKFKVKLKASGCDDAILLLFFVLFFFVYVCRLFLCAFFPVLMMMLLLLLLLISSFFCPLSVCVCVWMYVFLFLSRFWLVASCRFRVCISYFPIVFFIGFLLSFCSEFAKTLASLPVWIGDEDTYGYNS